MMVKTHGPQKFRTIIYTPGGKRFITLFKPIILLVLSMPKVTKTKQSRAWSFTDFERTADIKEIKADSRVRYVQWGEEICPETERKHRQGMVVFYKQQSMRVVQELVKNKCHCEPARNEWALEKYNAKDGNVVSEGEMVKQGSREDIKKAVNAAIEADGDVEKLIDAAPVEFVKYSRGLKEVMRVKEKKPAWRVVHTEVLWGKSGTGKSHYAPCVYGDANVFRSKRVFAKTQSCVQVEQSVIPLVGGVQRPASAVD